MPVLDNLTFGAFAQVRGRRQRRFFERSPASVGSIPYGSGGFRENQRRAC